MAPETTVAQTFQEGMDSLTKARGLLAAMALDALFKSDPDYDGACPGIGLPAPCPACGCDGFTNEDGTIRYHAVALVKA